MKRIPRERKEAILAKLAGPDRMSVEELAKQEGISVVTLYAWRKQARQEGRLMPDHDDSPQGWSSRMVIIQADRVLEHTAGGSGLINDTIGMTRQVIEIG